ncbi:hypothetical protein SAMN02982929_05274 [Saccharopolyspora kobensis]|uniref:Uncharacterized protein n=1 Tax=Saccharopolyspora kobensis TaxID=146035 RepID=A0A1H6DZS3_9PSEU|nr:hypothetical protein [Saccharopolyspora kobensis]SEG90619.1 hypothetical protein SAMN02982929_05274 [Saccharopolyspora kobensis]SFD92638.1 hypothetical protein SAMN05216506_107250 [Saccharopolyspora kobensis]
MTSETDRNDGPQDESLDSLPPELRIYAPAEGTPVRPAEPEKPAEPSYEQVPLASLSGTAQPQPAPPADPRPAKRVGLPSKFSLIALAGAAVVLVSVPFVVALLMTGQRETERVAIGMNASQEQGALVAPEPALPAGEPVEVPGETPEQQPVETQPEAPVLDPAPPPAEAPAREVSLLGGPGCANSAKQQYQAVGYYEQGDEGWYTRSGGSTEAGCKGTFDSMPMSGKAKTSDSRVFSRWTFDVSAEMTAASCAMSVYIPNESDRRYVGATAAHYSIFNGFDQAATNVIGVEDIDQTANRGKWVDLGAHRIDQGKISVKLHNRGEDWDGGADGDGAHVAATQIRVTCTAA